MVATVVGIRRAGVFADAIEILGTITKAELGANHETVAIGMNELADPLL